MTAISNSEETVMQVRVAVCPEQKRTQGGPSTAVDKAPRPGGAEGAQIFSHTKGDGATVATWQTWRTSYK